MKKEHPHSVAVLVLGYNHASTVVDTLRCALRQNYPSYEVFYIDNASQDASVELVRQHIQNVHIIENTENIGYAGAYKKALLKVFSEGFDTAVLLNPDTFFEEDWLSPLVESAYADASIAFAQPKIYLWENGKTDIFNSAGNHIHFSGMGFCGHYKERDFPRKERDEDIPYASGASLLVKKEVYEKLPGFDEDFFAYLEDQDLGWQARLFGYRNILSAHSCAWHKYDFKKKSLNNKKLYFLERNRFFFLLKHFETKTLLLVFPALLFFELGILAHSIVHGYFLKKIAGYKNCLKKLPATLKKRKFLQSRRQKTDKELFPLLSPTIEFEEVASPILTFANRFFLWYFSCIKNIL